MNSDPIQPNRRQLLTGGAAGFAALAAASLQAQEAPSAPAKTWRIGVISARIEGKPQPVNGHTWTFAQYLHPTVNLDAIAKYMDPGSARLFREHLRNPKENFGVLPFPDVRVTHYYEADPEIARMYCEAFPGVQPAESVEKMVQEVDAVWLGDASGKGEDHFDLVAPGLERGLPTFCDKPIGGSVAGTRKILELARKHRAPLMSSSLFRHQWGTEEALRMRDRGEFGDIQFVLASQAGAYHPDAWFVYGQHPTWMVVTLLGAGIEAVSMYHRPGSCHALITYPDRAPGEVWYGRPDAGETYCHTSVHFRNRVYQYTPAIEGNYWFGHHYQVFNLARVFREMLRTGVEPVPHQEILEVTAVIHAAARSVNERSRLVPLAEVLG